MATEIEGDPLNPAERSARVHGKIELGVPTTNWVQSNTTALTADNSGSPITAPALDTATHFDVDVSGCTTMLIRLVYTSVAALTVDAIVQAIGIDDNGMAANLYDANGDNQLTLQSDYTNDLVIASGLKATAPVEVDCDGHHFMRVGIVRIPATASVAFIQVKAK